MKCPICPDSTLVIADRQGIEIDYCPTCRGVWLDRGELDRLIERAAPAPAPSAPAPPAPPAAPDRRDTQPLPWYDDPASDRDDRVEYDKYGRPKKSKKKKASSFHEELFDF